MFKTYLDPIIEKLELPQEAVAPYGLEVAKVDPDAIDKERKGRVVLVTAMTPTPAGEGKTTTSIGLVDGLNKIGVKAVAALREPSLGPLFGLKGGAIGGGQAKVQPMDHINMHFTGDIHAVTSAHNLLSAMVDNAMYFGGKVQGQPELDPAAISWGRVMDMNDRAIRRVEVGTSTSRGPVRIDRFDITAASEVMAVLCMSKDVADLKARLARIVVGFDKGGNKVTAGDLKAEGAMAAVLLDATRPNLVRTLEDNPVFVHGGPFANIAQGTSTVRQTYLAQQVADVVITEGGFAFDLGGFKFCDLKGRLADIKPAGVVLVVTVRACRHHGGADFEAGPNLDAVAKGLQNVEAHIEAMARLGLPPPIISINRRPDDGEDEINLIKQTVQKHGANAVEGKYFADGGAGAEELARAVMKHLELNDADSPDYKPPYEVTEAVPTKIEKISKTVFGAESIALTDEAKKDLEGIERMGLGDLPVCMAKTHLSISDDKTVLGKPAPFELTVTGLRPAAGAGFVVALCGPVLTMPGLPKEPAAWGVDVEKGEGGWHITGLR